MLLPVLSFRWVIVHDAVDRLCSGELRRVAAVTFHLNLDLPLRAIEQWYFGWRGHTAHEVVKGFCFGRR